MTTQVHFRPGAGIASARTRDGTLMFPARDIYVGRSLLLYGEWCPMEPRVLTRLLRPGDIAVEVGANVGAHSLSLARAVGPSGRVFAIEPQPVIHQLLAANAMVNGLGQLSTVQVAIGDAAGLVHMPPIDYAREANFGGFSLDHLPQMPTEGAMCGVPVTTLDDLLDLPHLRLIKMDVEGWEPKVLRGARRLLERFRPILYAEAEQPEATMPILDAVAGLDYDAYWHVSPLFVPDNFNGSAENVFGAVSCVNMLLAPRGAEVLSNRPVTGPESHPRAGTVS